MALSNQLKNLFAIAEAKGGATDESQYYGPYDKLLNNVFHEDNFVVSPQFKSGLPAGLRSKESIDFGILFVVQMNMEPVFYVEVKHSKAIERISSRAEADDQMRQRINDLSDVIKIPVLYGVSALGTRLSFYTYDKTTNKIDPERIQPDPNKVNDVAPVELWKYDLMQADGEAKFFQVVKQVKDMCSALFK